MIIGDCLVSGPGVTNHFLNMIPQTVKPPRLAKMKIRNDKEKSYNLMRQKVSMNYYA